MSWVELLNFKLGDFLGIYTFLNFMVHYCLVVRTNLQREI